MNNTIKALAALSIGACTSSSRWSSIPRPNYTPQETYVYGQTWRKWRRRKFWQQSAQESAQAAPDVAWVRIELPPPFEAGHYYWQPQTDWVRWDPPDNFFALEEPPPIGDIFGDLVPQEHQRPVAFFVEWFSRHELSDPDTCLGYLPWSSLIPDGVILEKSTSCPRRQELRKNQNNTYHKECKRATTQYHQNVTASGCSVPTQSPNLQSCHAHLQDVDFCLFFYTNWYLGLSTFPVIVIQLLMSLLGRLAWSQLICLEEMMQLLGRKSLVVNEMFSPSKAYVSPAVIGSN